MHVGTFQKETFNQKGLDFGGELLAAFFQN